jgi:hypothetical protein
MGDRMLEQVFNLKFAVKQMQRCAHIQTGRRRAATTDVLARARCFAAADCCAECMHARTSHTTPPPLSQTTSSAVKCEKDEKAERLKVKKAIEKGNMEGAKVYAENAIRKKNEALSLMKLASRLDATVSRLDTQVRARVGWCWRC